MPEAPRPGVEGQNKDVEFQVWDRGTRLEDSEDFLPGAEIRSLVPAPGPATTPISHRVSRHHNWGPTWIRAIENMDCLWKFGDRKCMWPWLGFGGEAGQAVPLGIVTWSHRASLGGHRSQGVCGRMSFPPPHSSDIHVLRPLSARRGVDTLCTYNSVWASVSLPQPDLVWGRLWQEWLSR